MRPGRRSPARRESCTQPRSAMRGPRSDSETDDAARRLDRRILPRYAREWAPHHQTQTRSCPRARGPCRPLGAREAVPLRLARIRSDKGESPSPGVRLPVASRSASCESHQTPTLAPRPRSSEAGARSSEAGARTSEAGARSLEAGAHGMPAAPPRAKHQPGKPPLEQLALPPQQRSGRFIPSAAQGSCPSMRSSRGQRADLLVGDRDPAAHLASAQGSRSETPKAETGAGAQVTIKKSPPLLGAGRERIEIVRGFVGYAGLGFCLGFCRVATRDRCLATARV